MAKDPFDTENPDGLVIGDSFKAKVPGHTLVKQSFEAYREDAAEDEFITIMDCRMTRLPKGAPHRAEIINQFKLDPDDTIIALYIEGVEMVDTQDPKKSTAQGNRVFFVEDADNLYNGKIAKKDELRIKKIANFYYTPIDPKERKVSNLNDAKYIHKSFSKITNVTVDPNSTPFSSSPSSSHRTFKLYLYP